MDRKTRLDQELNRIVSILEDRYHPQRIILFGSLAHGKTHEWSDIDLAVVKESNQRFIERTGEILRLTRPQVGLNVVVYTPSEVAEMEASNHYFWKEEIVGKGRVLYDRAA